MIELSLEEIMEALEATGICKEKALELAQAAIDLKTNIVHLGEKKELDRWMGKHGIGYDIDNGGITLTEDSIIIRPHPPNKAGKYAYGDVNFSFFGYRWYAEKHENGLVELKVLGSILKKEEGDDEELG